MPRSGTSRILYTGSAISLFFYAYIMYVVDRHQSFQLMCSYIVLFIAFIALWYFARTSKQVRWLLVLAITLRLILILAFPNLSDDIYRFVWDGRLLNAGIHPFSHLPSYFMEPGSEDVPGITSSLYHFLNSPDYFTIYPPVAQFFFSLSAAVFPNSVHGSAIVIRAFIILAEIVSIWLITRIIFHYKLPRKNVLLYALNPLVILELTGNLHFEAFMIVFLLVAICFFLTKKPIMAALAFAFAIASKLVPLIFLPLFIKNMPVKKLWRFYSLIAVFTVILFLPLISMDLVYGMSSSLSLYFQKFEFNASIYYLLREVGFEVMGYNTIQTLGKYLALASFVLIMGYAFIYNSRRIKLPEAMFWVSMIYFLLATTVHPWYIATVILLSVFTKFRFPILWSFLIFLTYLGYSESGYQEILWLTTIEYSLVFVYMMYEVYRYYIQPPRSLK